MRLSLSALLPTIALAGEYTSPSETFSFLTGFGASAFLHETQFYEKV
jgi:hypothetical protein